MLQRFRPADGDEVPETERSPQGVFPPVVQRRTVQDGVYGDLPSGTERVSANGDTQEVSEHEPGPTIPVESVFLLLFFFFRFVEQQAEYYVDDDRLSRYFTVRHRYV